MEINGYVWGMLEGMQLTIILALLSMSVAILLGLLGAWAKLSDSALARTVANIYTVVVRGIPELLLLLLIFYGVPTFIQDTASTFGFDITLDLNPLIAGVITIGFVYGAFSTEVFRGAYQSLPKGQIEAAVAIGMPRFMRLHRVILPQMMRVAIPGLSNVWLILLKATALVSVIQLEELMRKTRIASGATREPFSYYFLASVLFLIITLVSMYLQGRLEKWANKGFEER